MLESFVKATLLARAMADDPDQFTKWEKATRLQASLATRLRLTPASRSDPKTIARNLPYDGPRPWLRDNQEED
ncbi:MULTISPECIES: hypothetical protein [unclassified Bradyrhizobium]